MTQISYAVNETPVPESTLVDLFFEGIDRWGDETAFQRFQTSDQIVDITPFIAPNTRVRFRVTNDDRGDFLFVDNAQIGFSIGGGSGGSSLPRDRSERRSVGKCSGSGGGSESCDFG